MNKQILSNICLEAIEVSPAMTFISDLSGKVIYVNKTFLDHFKLKKDQFLGTKASDWFSNASGKETLKSIKKILRSGRKGFIKEVIHETREKGVVHLDVRLSPIKKDSKIYAYVAVVEDITSFREQKERFSSIIENLPLHIGAIDESGKFYIWNKYSEKMFGYKKSELIGKKTPEIIHETVKDAKMVLREAAKKGIFEGELKFVRKDGKKILGRTIIIPKKDEKGKITGFFGIIEDVSEKKELMSKLKESESRYREFVEGSQDVFTTIDPKGFFKFYNRRFSEVTGYGINELIGKNGFKYIHPQDLPLVTKAYNRILKGHKVTNAEFRFKSKSGAYIWYSVNGVPHRNDEGKIIGIRTISRDITEKRRLESELEESEKRYRELVETSLDYFWSLDKKGRFLYYNKRVAETTGHDLTELIGKSAFDIVHPDDVRDCRKAFQDCIKNDKPVKMEFQMLSADGKCRWISTIVKPFYDAKNRVIGARGIGRDITEVKEFEEKKEMLIRDVSHELKTPVAMAKMLHHRLDDAIEDKDWEEISNIRDFINANLIRLEQDTRNVLDMFTLATMERVIKREPEKYDIKQALQGIFAHIKFNAENKGLKFNVKIRRFLPKLNINKYQLMILVRNLLENALKFTKRGKIEIEIKKKKRQLLISVKDTGVGISKTDLKKVFERFYKAKKDFPGVGLGLNICKQIVDSYEGDIKVMSKGKNKGTEVRVSLPL